MVRKHRRKGGRITGSAFQAHSDVDTVMKYKETAIKAGKMSGNFSGKS